MFWHFKLNRKSLSAFKIDDKLREICIVEDWNVLAQLWASVLRGYKLRQPRIIFHLFICLFNFLHKTGNCSHSDCGKMCYWLVTSLAYNILIRLCFFGDNGNRLACFWMLSFFLSSSIVSFGLLAVFRRNNDHVFNKKEIYEIFVSTKIDFLSLLPKVYSSFLNILKDFWPTARVQATEETEKRLQV